jgi:hypothetical protein
MPQSQLNAKWSNKYHLQHNESCNKAEILNKQRYSPFWQMASWRERLFQLVLAIIGSSLFGLALTNLYSILSQPFIDIQVNPINSNHIKGDYFNNDTLRTTVTNLGRTAANDIRLTMAFNSMLKNYTVFTTENTTSRQEIRPIQKLQMPSSIVINVPRLSPNSIIIVNTETDAPSSKHPYFISAAYGQNTVIRTNAGNATYFLSRGLYF